MSHYGKGLTAKRIFLDTETLRVFRGPKSSIFPAARNLGTAASAEASFHLLLSAQKAGHVDWVLALDKISDALQQLVRKNSPNPVRAPPTSTVQSRTMSVIRPGARRLQDQGDK